MKKLLTILAIVIVIGGGLIWWNQSRDEISTTGEPIKIGFIGPFSGTSAPMGEEQRTAFNIAVDEINSSGGVNGQSLQVIYEDGKGEGKPAISAAQKLVNINQVKILISVSSSETLAIAPIAQEKRVPLLAVWPTNPQITEAGEYVFRNSYSDADTARVTASYINQKNSEVLVLTEETAYGVGLSDAFKKNFKGSVYEERFLPDAKDVRTPLSRLLAKGNSLPIFLIPNSPATGLVILKQLRELGFKGDLIGNFIGDSPSIFSSPEAQGMVFVSDPEVSNSAKKDSLWMKFRDKRGSDPEFSFAVAATYDATYMIRDAIEGNGYDAEGIKNYLSKLTNFDGVLGTYGFDQNGDTTGLNPVIKQIKNGKAVDYQP